MSTQAPSLDYEIWRRAQDHREAARVDEATDADRMLVPLVLALARLAAQRESARRPLATSPPQDR